MLKSKLYNLIKAINIALHALRVKQKVIELKLRLLPYITYIKIKLLNS